MPSVFFPSNEFSAKIPWDGEKDIVWQGKDNQQVIMCSQYLSLSIYSFQDGRYQNILDIFDMDGVAMIGNLYNNATEVSSDELMSFDEEKYNQYLIITIPIIRGVFAREITDEDELYEDSLDERIFLYQEEDQYYFHKQGQHLKKVSEEDVSKILDYIQ